MKLAPVDRELVKRGDVEHVIVHTGQHFDPEMSATFFEQLWIPAPDHHLGVAAACMHCRPAVGMSRSGQSLSNSLRAPGWSSAAATPPARPPSPPPSLELGLGHVGGGR